MINGIDSIIGSAAALTSAQTDMSSSSAGFLAGAATGTEAAATPFADLVTGAVDQVNKLQAAAQTAVSGLMTGSGVDVHQATIATEKADMAFELALSVRNKAVQAYQSVMGMQF
jgi:flagellar hook-basal body complex protein FliE